MSDQLVDIKKGLEGVVADTTTISKVMPEINALVYRGYPVSPLAEQCCFEEVAYLLWNEELPNQRELAAFKEQEKSKRDISESLQELIRNFPKSAHPMDRIRTAVSFLGMEDKRVFDISKDTNRDKALKLLSSVPTMIAFDYRLRKGLPPLAPDPELDWAANFLYMCFGEVPKDEILKAFEVSMVLYAEHGFNASTFTGRVIASTTSDLHSAVVGAIGALKGPLHGGANEQVMYVLKEIGQPQNAKTWVEKALSEKKKIMGFGHRVYRKGDSRVPLMKKYLKKVATLTGNKKWVEISDVMEEVMVERKKIYPNVDFPAGPAYYIMGFDIDLFTPLFVMARVVGWTAHIMEQSANNRIVRPLCEYKGEGEREVPALSERK